MHQVADYRPGYSGERISPSRYSSCATVDEVCSQFSRYHRRIRDFANALAEIDSTLINQGTTSMRQPQLGFHSIHGTNVVILKNGKVARRRESFCKGLAFSNRPIGVDENVCLRLSEVATNWSGVLRFGVTNVDPETYRNIPVPKFACPDLTAKEGYWAKALPERYSVEGNILHFYINGGGELFYGINGNLKGLFLTGINVNHPMWLIVDIYGNSVSLEFIDSAEVTTQRRSSSVSALPRIPAFGSSLNESEPTSSNVSTNPSGSNDMTSLRFHTVTGRHISLNSQRNTATRDVQEYALGYVFTERPIQNNEKLSIVVTAVQHLYEGGLAFGVTCCDPSTLRATELPEDSSALIDMPQYWVVIKDIALQPRVNSILSFWITDSGEVKFEHDNKEARTVLHVDNSLPLYMYFDVYGATQAIKLLGISRSSAQNHVFNARVNMPTRRAVRNGESSQEVSGNSSLETSSRPTPRINPSVSIPVRVNTAERTRQSIDDLLGGPPTMLPPPALPRTPPPVAPRTNPYLPAPPARPPLPTISNQPLRQSSQPPMETLTTPMVRSPISAPSTLAETATSASAGRSSAVMPVSAPLATAAAPKSASFSAPPPVNDKDECLICMENTINAVLYTCGHMCMCYDCAQQQLSRSGTCPMCRKDIRDVIRIYKS
ncbi:unnamed protein product [Caenorhabditis auriculariae]|uniref:Protein neuralized n=1 Tax=Caenorhabditis auriculariae TaxID=2777116 RepID=A0A8S1GND7_9PELO|nr:unnamed protein product [Caenorhabditis auriculariae]